MELTDATVFTPEWDEERGGPVLVRDFLTAAARLEGGGEIRLLSKSRETEGVERMFRVHSEEYMWGYGGSGPAELALNILGNILPPPEAWRLHHDFKFHKLTGLAMDMDHVIPWKDVVAWVRNVWAREDRILAARGAPS